MILLGGSHAIGIFYEDDVYRLYNSNDLDDNITELEGLLDL